MEDPIRAEEVRAELDDLGLRYFLDVRATVRRMLEQMRGEQRTAFAAAAAQRPLREDEQRPARERLPQVARWRGVLDEVWRCLAGDPTAPREVEVALGRYYLDPDYHGHEPDDPADAAAHAVWAALYTCECCLHGCLEFATWAGWRGFDWATVQAAADPTWPHRRPAEVSPYVWELAHPRLQAELDRQLADLEQLAVAGDVLLDPAADRQPLLARLRA